MTEREIGNVIKSAKDSCRLLYIRRSLSCWAINKNLCNPEDLRLECIGGESEKVVLEAIQDVCPLNKFRCMPSDKKQLYLLILWIHLRAASSSGFLALLILILQSTARRPPPQRRNKAKRIAPHATISMSAWITAHGISGADFSFFVSSYSGKGKCFFFQARNSRRVQASHHSQPHLSCA